MACSTLRACFFQRKNDHSTQKDKQQKEPKAIKANIVHVSQSQQTIMSLFGPMHEDSDTIYSDVVSNSIYNILQKSLSTILLIITKPWAIN